MNANWLAYFALISWPVVAILFYKSLPAPRATILTIFCALLVLPSVVSIKLQMIPSLDKNSIPALCALVGCLLVGQPGKRRRYGFGIAEVLALSYGFGPFLTSALNNDDIIVGSTFIPGVGNYDAVSAMLSQLLAILPFFIGRYFLREAEDTRNILRAIVAGGLLYSLPMLFEIRMSPQLSNWIYGYFPSSFSTEGRYGGFRPVVFFDNGLALSFFVMTAVLASVALWRAKVRFAGLPAAAIPSYLAAVLVLCKSLGALIYAGFAGPLVGWARPRSCVRVAVLLVSIALLYPLLRAEGLFPDKLLVSIAEQVNAERAGSLLTRFEQEQQLLDRSSQRPIFGWGRFGRSRVYDEYGKDISLTDGLWIITLGSFGLVGFLAQFGLLALPVFRAASSLKFATSDQERLALATLTLIVALGLVEQLPNSSLGSWNWLLAGSLLGRAERLKAVFFRATKRRSTVALSLAER
jgi:hypothetical protein